MFPKSVPCASGGCALRGDVLGTQLKRFVWVEEHTLLICEVLRFPAQEEKTQHVLCMCLLFSGEKCKFKN